MSIHCVHWKGKPAISSLFNEHEVLSFASEKAKLFAKNILKNNNLDDSSMNTVTNRRSICEFFLAPDILFN